MRMQNVKGKIYKEIEGLRMQEKSKNKWLTMLKSKIISMNNNKACMKSGELC